MNAISRLAVVLLMLGSLQAAAPAMVWAQGCSIATVGVDTSRADTYAGTIFGEGLVQSFSAADTLLRSIAVWRPAPQDSFLFPYKLWILRADSVGIWRRDSVVYEGPDLIGPYGDGIHPTEINFLFDPPLALPYRGAFAFAVQNRCAGATDLIADDRDEYADGGLWISSRSDFSGCILAGGNAIPGYDLVFTIEFCDTSTPVKRRSWGEVKTLYR